MSEERRICTTCKGCGTLPLKRQRTYSDDPTKKWCNLCKNFLDKEKEFYVGTGYCKKCQSDRVRIKRYDPEKRKKYESNCYTCGNKFLGYKLYQLYCSRRCNCIAMGKKKAFNAYSLLPNELRDQILSEEGFI